MTAMPSEPTTSAPTTWVNPPPPAASEVHHHHEKETAVTHYRDEFSPDEAMRALSLRLAIEARVTWPTRDDEPPADVRLVNLAKSFEAYLRGGQ